MKLCHPTHLLDRSLQLATFRFSLSPPASCSSSSSLISSSSKLTLDHFAVLKPALVRAQSSSSPSLFTPPRLLSLLQPAPATGPHHAAAQQLDKLVDRALHDGHLDPRAFAQLASSCARGPRELRALVCGAVILNDQPAAMAWMAELGAEPADTRELYPNLFRALGRAGRGMGMMRRVVRALRRANRLEAPIVEAYVDCLIRWGELPRAWAYLSGFYLGPAVDLWAQAAAIGGPFAHKVARLRPQEQVWRPSSSAHASLISIYLLLDRPELALQLDSVADLARWDDCAALLVCARAMLDAATDTRDRPSLDPHTLPPAVGPTSATVLAKLMYHHFGPAGFADYLRALPCQKHNRALLGAWLDLLLHAVHPRLLPRELASWLDQLEEHGLLGERELEKYLRYTREWLEEELRGLMRRSCSQRSPAGPRPNACPMTISPDDPRLGYGQLETLLRTVYQPPRSLQPSSTAVAELVRIEAMVGTAPGKLFALVGEMARSQMPTRTSHLIGLVWSKLVAGDVVGLARLVEVELQLKYKLVLTGVLTSLLLAGLIAIRPPKLVILGLSQRLVEQTPMVSLRKKRWQPAGAITSVGSYVGAIKAAVMVGDLWLARELHEEMLGKYGRAEAYGEGGAGPDHVVLMMGVLMRLGDPVGAQREAQMVVERADVWLGAGEPEAAAAAWAAERQLLATGPMVRYLDEQAVSRIAPPKEGARSSGIRLRDTLRRTHEHITRKAARLERLSSQFKKSNAEEWEVRKHFEIEGRLASFKEAQAISNQVLNELKEKGFEIEEREKKVDKKRKFGSGGAVVGGRRRGDDEAGWVEGMKVGLEVVRKLVVGSR